MSKIKWRIIKNNLGNGTTEYQVSDGDVGERTVSYDFDNRLDAEECLCTIEKQLKLKQLIEQYQLLKMNYLHLIYLVLTKFHKINLEFFDNLAQMSIEILKYIK